MSNTYEEVLREEAEFRKHLGSKGLTDRTVSHHINCLGSPIVKRLLNSDCLGSSIYDLDPNTHLYIIQAKVCLSGVTIWKDIWTAINYLREWKLGCKEVHVDYEALKQTLMCIVEGQNAITKELQKVFDRFLNMNVSDDDLFSKQSLFDDLSMEEREKKLCAWEKDLTQREHELREKLDGLTKIRMEASIVKRGRKPQTAAGCLRTTLKEHEIEWLKETTVRVHRTFNIGKSDRLAFLMIVMRDLGYLIQNVGVTGFLRLLEEWKIVTAEDSRPKGSVMIAIRNLLAQLPDGGKMSFRSKEWLTKPMQEYKQYCDKLAEYYEVEAKKEF